jgi:hypothetical protein
MQRSGALLCNPQYLVFLWAVSAQRNHYYKATKEQAVLSQGYMEHRLD